MGVIGKRVKQTRIAHSIVRYQVESTSPRDVCLWAGFPASRCLLPYTRTSTTSTTASVGPHSNDTDAGYDSHSAYSMHPHTYLPDAMEYTGRRYLAHNNTNTSADSAGVTWPDLDKEDVSLANEVTVCVLCIVIDVAGVCVACIAHRMMPPNFPVAGDVPRVWIRFGTSAAAIQKLNMIQ